MIEQVRNKAADFLNADEMDLDVRYKNTLYKLSQVTGYSETGLIVRAIKTRVNKHLKKTGYFKGVKVSVKTQKSTAHVAIYIDLEIKQGADEAKAKAYAEALRNGDDVDSIRYLATTEKMNARARMVKEVVEKIAMDYRHVDNDPMTDYYWSNFYLHVHVDADMISEHFQELVKEHDAALAEAEAVEEKEVVFDEWTAEDESNYQAELERVEKQNVVAVDFGGKQAKLESAADTGAELDRRIAEAELEIEKAEQAIKNLEKAIKLKKLEAKAAELAAQIEELTSAFKDA